MPAPVRRDEDVAHADASGASAPLLEGLAPIAAPDAATLVLGSFPGEQSLRERRYYAHPRNQFWPIMGELAGADPTLEYEARLARLVAHRIALWDVLRACSRAGSLDSRIRDPRANDFASLFARLPQLQRVLLNGSTAATLFERHVRPVLDASGGGLRIHRLPSTSPAHAGMRFVDKCARWRAALEDDRG